MIWLWLRILVIILKTFDDIYYPLENATNNQSNPISSSGVDINCDNMEASVISRRPKRVVKPSARFMTREQERMYVI